VYIHICIQSGEKRLVNDSENISFVEKCFRQKLQGLKRSIYLFLSVRFWIVSSRSSQNQFFIDFFLMEHPIFNVKI